MSESAIEGVKDSIGQNLTRPNIFLSFDSFNKYLHVSFCLKYVNIFYATERFDRVRVRTFALASMSLCECPSYLLLYHVGPGVIGPSGVPVVVVAPEIEETIDNCIMFVLTSYYRKCIIFLRLKGLMTCIQIKVDIKH